MTARRKQIDQMNVLRDTNEDLHAIFVYAFGTCALSIFERSDLDDVVLAFAKHMALEDAGASKARLKRTRDHMHAEVLSKLFPETAARVKALGSPSRKTA
jgi:hypothetical protein